MPKIVWDRHFGRQLRLRDLHVFVTVASCGSMAKAATKLGISTPTVSEVIASLERELGVKILDRSSKGVHPTKHGDALLKRTLVIFEELKSGIKDLERLSDPEVGEVKIASTLSVSFTIIPHILERFQKQYPQVVLHFDEVTAGQHQDTFRHLRDRKYDLIIGRWSLPSDTHSVEDFKIEVIFFDQLVVAAGTKNKWAACGRKIDLAELIDEPWIMQEPQTWSYQRLAEACNERGVPMPKARMVTLSTSVNTYFLENRQFITAMPRSMAYFHSLKSLPVDLPSKPWPVSLATLEHRAQSPTVERFIECVREYARSLREMG